MLGVPGVIAASDDAGVFVTPDVIPGPVPAGDTVLPAGTTVGDVPTEFDPELGSVVPVLPVEPVVLELVTVLPVEPFVVVEAATLEPEREDAPVPVVVLEVCANARPALLKSKAVPTSALPAIFAVIIWSV